MNKKATRSVHQKARQKKNLFRVLMIFGVLFLALGVSLLLIWQNTTTANRDELATPTNLLVRETDDGKVLLSFNPVTDASSYVLRINDIVESISDKETTVDITRFVEGLGEYTISVQAIGGELHKNSNISNVVKHYTYMSLPNPEPQLSYEDGLIAWPNIENADYYEIMIQGQDSIFVDTNEFNFSDIVVQNEKVYKFIIVARSNNEYINSSTIDQTKMVEIYLTGKMETPTDLSFNQSTKVFSWSAVEKAQSYTVYLNKDGWTSQKELKATTNSLNLASYMIERGSYKFCVKANAYAVSDISWYLASEKSQKLSHIVKTTLEAPQNLKATLSVTDVIFTWNAVQNANGYIIEILNEDNEIYYSDTVYSTTAQISRTISENLASDLKVRVYALGWGYFNNSNYSDVITVDAKDQMASPKNVSVTSSGKRTILTFDAVTTNVEGNATILKHNGYVLTIIVLDNLLQPTSEILTMDINSTSVDLTNNLLLPINFGFIVKTKAYAYYTESEESEMYVYKHKVQLGAPSASGFKLINQGQADEKLVYYWTHVNKTPDYQIVVRTDNQAEKIQYVHIIYGNGASGEDMIVSKGASEQVGDYAVQKANDEMIDPNLLWNAYDPELQAIAFYYDVKYLYLRDNEQNILEYGQSIYAAVRAIENPSYFVDNYYNGEWATLSQYKNYVALETPEILQINKKTETNCTIRLTSISYASSYLIEVTNVVTGEVYRQETMFTTANIYSLLSPGDNIIRVKAIGSDYYLDSEFSQEVRFNYTMKLQAPYDVVLNYDAVNGKYLLSFTTTRFAEFYKVKIKLENNRNGDTNNDYTVLDTEYVAGVNTTVCDITEFIVANGYGRYIINVQSQSSNANATASDWSIDYIYNLNEKLVLPTDLVFNNETKELTWSTNINATNGYYVEIVSQLDVPVRYNKETLESVFDMTEILNNQDGIGTFLARIMAKEVKDKYYSSSDWTDYYQFTVSDTLDSPKDFIFNENTSYLSWTSDYRSVYDTLYVNFKSDTSVEERIVDIDANQFYSSKGYSFAELFNEYGFGWYYVFVTSHATNPLLASSEESLFTVINYKMLQTPNFVSVTGNKGSNSVIATFETVEKGKTYTILAKTNNETEYTAILADISSDIATDGKISIQIYDYLANFAGANAYNLVVRADGYDFYKTSELSNVKSYELWLKHFAPSNLRVETEQENIILKWDNNLNAESYQLIINNIVINEFIDKNSYNLTDFLALSNIGLYEIYVRANQSGYWLNGDYSKTEYIKKQQIATPTLAYDSENQTLLIGGQTDVNLGFSLNIEFDNLKEQKTYFVPYVSVKEIPLKYLFNDYGVGNYKATVVQLGDGTYWLDSQSSNEVEVKHILPLQSPALLAVDKRKNGEDFEFYVSFQKGMQIDNILTELSIYQVSDINSYELENLTAVYTFNTLLDAEINITNYVELGHYYVITAKHLGLNTLKNQQLYPILLSLSQ